MNEYDKRDVENVIRQFNDEILMFLKHAIEDTKFQLNELRKDCQHSFIEYFGMSSSSDSTVCEHCLLEMNLWSKDYTENYQLNFPSRHAEDNDSFLSPMNLIQSYQIDKMIKGLNTPL